MTKATIKERLQSLLHVKLDKEQRSTVTEIEETLIEMDLSDVAHCLMVLMVWQHENEDHEG